MGTQNTESFDPEFPIAGEVFLSTEPMTDDEFEQFVRIKNDEIPIEDSDFLSDLPA